MKFTAPRPASLKNRRILTVRNGVPISIPSRDAQRSAREIASAATEAANCLGALPLHGDDDVAVTITHHVNSDTVTVTTASIGPRRKGKSGRRADLQNIPEVILDALEGIAFNNDNQVARLTMERDFS